MSMTTPRIEEIANKIVEAGKQRADWFEPSAEVILATTAKEQIVKAHQAGIDEEREQTINSYKSFIQYIEEYNEPQTVVRVCRSLIETLTAPTNEEALQDNK